MGGQSNTCYGNRSSRHIITPPTRNSVRNKEECCCQQVSKKNRNHHLSEITLVVGVKERSSFGSSAGENIMQIAVYIYLQGSFPLYAITSNVDVQVDTCATHNREMREALWKIGQSFLVSHFLLFPPAFLRAQPCMQTTKLTFECFTVSHFS